MIENNYGKKDRWIESSVSFFNVDDNQYRSGQIRWKSIVESGEKRRFGFRSRKLFDVGFQSEEEEEEYISDGYRVRVLNECSHL